MIHFSWFSSILQIIKPPQRLKTMQIWNFTIFTVSAIIFWQFMATFHFFLLPRELDHSTSDLLKRYDIYRWTFWKFLFVDYPNEDCNKREFKSKIIDETLNLPKKSSKTREASVKSGTKLNITTSILELLKISSEVIAASKYGPLARIKYQKPIKYQNSKLWHTAGSSKKIL